MLSNWLTWKILTPIKCNHWYCNLLQFLFTLIADPCYNYQNLSDANRRSNYDTPLSGPVSCDNELSDGWYRFVGAAGTRMPTTRVLPHKCDTDWSGWLNGAHPTMEDGEVYRKVCFSDRHSGCKFVTNISVKNCGSYFIYKLRPSFTCNTRYCATNWIKSKDLKIEFLINRSEGLGTLRQSKWSSHYYTITIIIIIITIIILLADFNRPYQECRQGWIKNAYFVDQVKIPVKSRMRTE